VYLKRLEIQGFKTFAARTVFEFRPGITAIVGPNGSGKSNVADSIRWVLGEQSYAALRSRRTEDLLFSGGGRRAPSGLAEVSLTIDNADRLLPLPYGEVTLTRRATRAGDNEYFINRNRVRLRDLQEAIGPLGGSYTIINQGLVDAALTLRPEERRRLFEDAAEISVFEARKADAQRKLRETATNLDRCADVLADLEPRMRSLKRQAGLARSYRELNAELRELLRRHYVAQWHATQQALAESEQAEARLAVALEAHRAEQAAATAALRSTRDQLRALRERLGALHAESSALHTHAEAAQRDLAVGNERQAALTRRGEEFERGLREFNLRREELERDRAAAATRLAAADGRLAEQRAALATHGAALAAHDAARRAARRTLDAATRAELEAAAALAERRRRAAQLLAQRDRLAQAQAGSGAVLVAAEVAITSQRAALAGAQEHFAASEQAAAAASMAVEHARADLDGLRAERARADETLAQARRAQADVEARLETLGRLQRSYAGTFAGVKAAMQWAEKEGRAGLTLVASILRTPAHLETAIEVALGSRLQNIVVERWEDAEQAIEALKRGGQGRATFLPLDTIRGQGSGIGGQGSSSDPRSLTPDPTVLGVAADLVEFDEHYAAIVRQLLGRTLVVEDMATARRELRRMTGGWTIVTLAGEQVSSGGAVTGGAQIKESGTLRRERELRELPDQVAARQAAVAQATEARGALESRTGAAERAIRAADTARQRANQERETRRATLDKARRAVDQAEAELDLQRRRHEQSVVALAELDEQQAIIEAEQAALAAREAEARAHLAQLRADDQGRADAERAVQERIATLRVALSAAEGEARAERVLLHSNEQNLARLGEQRAASLGRLDELAGERAALETQLHALHESHATLLAQIDELRRRIGPAETELADLETSQAGLERQEADQTAALLAAESAHGRATVDVQRARDRRDAVWERAAADDIDIEAATQEPRTESREPLDAEDATQNSKLNTQNSLADEIERLRERLRRLGVVNPLALEEYEEESKRHTFLSTQTADLRAAEAGLRELIGDLDAAMQLRFEATFHAVAAEFERSFTRLFGGGQAQLLLTRSNSANGNGESHERMEGLGVEILARPPGKRQQTLSLLSGGERSLTASALLFAILKVNPSPFCVLDEVDAALDEANVGRFREALAELGEQTQFLLVTHNRGTIEAADTIYGVSMGEDGASRVLSLRLEELVEE
jgi:chromosome segregation protein